MAQDNPTKKETQGPPPEKSAENAESPRNPKQPPPGDAGRIATGFNPPLSATACISGNVTTVRASKCGTSSASTPFVGVPLILIKDGAPAGQTVTGLDGGFEFSGLDCGNYVVVPAPSFQGLIPNPGSFSAGFLAGNNVTSANFSYIPVPGVIQGRLVLLDGAGIAGQPVILKDSNNSTTVDQTVTDGNGAYQFTEPNGSYKLNVPLTIQAGFGQTIPISNPGGISNPNVISVTSPSIVPDVVYDPGALVGAITGQFQQLSSSAATIASIIPTAMQGSYQSSASSIGGVVAYDQVVEASLTRVLGARASSDPVKILNMLNSAFKPAQQNGQTYYSWQPRGVTDVTTSMGQLVGAQVTIYQEVQDIQTQVTRLLDAVEPVILDADQDDIDFQKREIGGSLALVVSEAGRPGGAVTPRLQVLLQTIQTDLTTLETKLGFGTTNPAILIDMDVTEAEQNQKNFDFLKTLLTQNGTLDSLLKAGTAGFKGTQLARLNWLTEVVPNTVQQVYSAMDSVGFGPADRRVTQISGTDPTTIEQLLLWIESAASVDWPNNLVAGSARLSEVRAIRREADSQSAGVQTLLNSLSTIILIGADRPRPVLEELKRELDQASSLAQSIAP
jgi:hypothetical protein